MIKECPQCKILVDLSNTNKFRPFCSERCKLIDLGVWAYAQKNPKNEYKREAYEMFESMLNAINTEAVKILFRLELATEEELKELEERAVKAQKNKEMQLQQAQPESGIEEQDAIIPNAQTVTRNEPKLGRNDPCHCGSGKKLKQCHGKT